MKLSFQSSDQVYLAAPQRMQSKQWDFIIYIHKTHIWDLSVFRWAAVDAVKAVGYNYILFIYKYINETQFSDQVYLAAPQQTQSKQWDFIMNIYKVNSVLISKCISLRRSGRSQSSGIYYVYIESKLSSHI